MKKKLLPSWPKRIALEVFLKSPRRVQIRLAKYGIKKAVHKKTEDLKKLLT